MFILILCLVAIFGLGFASWIHYFSLATVGGILILIDSVMLTIFHQSYASMHALHPTLAIWSAFASGLLMIALFAFAGSVICTHFERNQ